MVLCPGRGERWFNWLKDLLENAGARVKVTTATEHDRLMSVVQGLAHFTLIALEMAIRELGVSPQDLEDFATPTFATLHSLARRLFSQDAKLYACIQLANPANRVALRALEDAVADILYFIQRQNADGLVRLIESVKEGFILKNKQKRKRTETNIFATLRLCVRIYVFTPRRKVANEFSIMGEYVMLDLKFVRDHLDEVEQALKNRGQEISLEEFQSMEGSAAVLARSGGRCAHERNTLSQKMGAEDKSREKGGGPSPQGTGDGDQ